MKYLTFEQESIESLIEAGICTGCGMCQAACPEEAVQMKLIRRGWFQANIDETKCTGCGLCARVCGRHPANNQEGQVQNGISAFLGNFENCYLGHSADTNIRFNATSGGLITSLLAFGLKNHIIDAAIVVAADPENPLLTNAVIATSEKEILGAGRSRYAPVPVNAALKQALNLGRRIALVGLPCHIRSLDKAKQHWPELKEKVILKLGLFCSHNLSFCATDFVLLHKKINAADVTDFSYRGKGWPGGIRVTTEKGVTTYIPNNTSVWTSLFSCFLYAPPYCLSCIDQTNEMADISFGDPWLPDILVRDTIGSSVCVVRTNMGRHLLNKANKANVIALTKLDASDVVASQKWPLYFKKINIICRKHLCPQNLKLNEILKIFKPAATDRFISRFAIRASSLSNWMAQNKYLGYITARLIIALSKPYRKRLTRRTEELMNRLIQSKPDGSEKSKASGSHQNKIDAKASGTTTKVVIVNQHCCNRGDEAALRGMLFGLKQAIPEADFTVMTFTCASDFAHIGGAKYYDSIYLSGLRFARIIYYTLSTLTHRYGPNLLAKLFTKKRYFIESLKNADLVISAPGGPYFGDLYKSGEITNAFVIFLAKLLGKPVMIYAPSMGPFNDASRNKWRKLLLSHVDTISVREPYSKSYLENLGINCSSIYLTTDSCLQTPVNRSLSEKILHDERIATDKMLIGVSPLYKFPSDLERDAGRAQELAVETLRLLADIYEANFILLPQIYGTYCDRPTMLQIASQSGLDGQVIVLPDFYDSDQQQSLIGHCDLFVSFRYHPFIFSVRQGIPSICVAYEHKAFGFASAMNLQEYCLDLYSVSPERIVKKVQEVWAKREDFKKCVHANLPNLEKLALKNSELAAGLLNKSKTRPKKNVTKSIL